MVVEERRYVVHLSNVLQGHVMVTAAGPEGAVEAAKASPDYPVSPAPGAFGDSSFVDAGWSVTRVTDELGAEVWRPVDGS